MNCSHYVLLEIRRWFLDFGSIQGIEDSSEASILHSRPLIGSELTPEPLGFRRGRQPVQLIIHESLQLFVFHVRAIPLLEKMPPRSCRAV